jgi:LytS/YehU family sensor histidine kinase
VVTLAVLALALYARQISGYSPLSLADLTSFEFDSYALGIAIQELAVPVVLVYIFSTTALFRRVISGEAKARDTLKLFGVLLVIQLLSLNYLFALSVLTNEQITFGTLIVVVGSLLGGWRMGLGLGLVTMFVYGIHELILYPEDGLLFLYQAEGLRTLFDLGAWSHLLVWRYLADTGVSSLAWAGIVAGLGADLLGVRRFAPLAALGLEVGVDLGVGYLTAISWEDPTVLIYFLIPSVVVSGLAMAAIALMMRSVQVEAARRKAEAAELALAQAELRALRAQINPHFLFNALNTIRYFVRTDAGAARRLLLDLSEVFQRTLRSGEFVPLRDELSYVEAYLALEKARLDKRLQIAWSIQTDTGTHDAPPVVNESPLLDYPVPTLILQPIVENAVIHGIAKKRGGGLVSITVKQMGDDLLLQVEDDGPGVETTRLEEILNPERESEKSIGLRNVDKRLRTLYGDEYRLIITSEVEHGTCVQIRVPI